MPVADSHGLIFLLDFEWNHWVFNVLYLLLLGIVFYGCQFYKIDGITPQNRLVHVMFAAAFGVQGYHFIEHSVRIVQFLQSGCTPCPGILGSFFDGVYLHFALNATVYILPLIAFILFGFPRRLLRKLDLSN